MDENIDALSIELTPQELNEINEIFHPNNVHGDRYAHKALTFHGQKK